MPDLSVLHKEESVAQIQCPIQIMQRGQDTDPFLFCNPAGFFDNQLFVSDIQISCWLIKYQ